jgi:hypothetical protein
MAARCLSPTAAARATSEAAAIITQRGRSFSGFRFFGRATTAF